MKYTNLMKSEISKGKYTEKEIEQTINNPDISGVGMNPNDKGYVKQFGDKIIVITQMISGGGSVEVFNHLGDIEKLKDKTIMEIILMGNGAKENSFYNKDDNFRSFGYMEINE